MKMKLMYLGLAVIPLLLSPIFQLIHNHIQLTKHNGGVGLGGIGVGLITLFNYAFILLVCILGVILFFRLQNRIVVLNPLKLIIQWDGVAKNIIRVLGYAQIYISWYSISKAMPVPYREWIGPYALMCGIFGLIGAITYMLVFCSTESV